MEVCLWDKHRKANLETHRYYLQLQRLIRIVKFKYLCRNMVDSKHWCSIKVSLLQIQWKVRMNLKTITSTQAHLTVLK